MGGGLGGIFSREGQLIPSVPKAKQLQITQRLQGFDILFGEIRFLRFE